MRFDSFYPVVLTDDVERSSAFFTEQLGFQTTFASDWYISLVHGTQPAYQLAFVLRTHPSVPPPLRAQSSQVLLTFEVPDAAWEFKRLQAAGLQIVEPLRDEPWGQRHFIGATQDGIMIDVVEIIPATADYADQYAALP
jgi:catechol 2,3-dioxygenase-like lactoylglutathione lyase family enzyme